MDQIPAAPPRVTYENGLLSITAQNATLGEILRDVRKLTGALIDIPPGGGGERVVVQLGPGAPRDVLALLLNGSSFNYVMLGSTSDPMAVASVMLMPKPSAAGAVSGEVQTAANTPANVYQPPPTMPPGRFPGPQGFRRPPGAPGAAAAADDSADDSDADDDDDSDQAQPVQGPEALPDIQTQIEQQGIDPNQPNAGPKTPEQLLEMMRRGQQPGAPAGPPVANPNPPQQ